MEESLMYTQTRSFTRLSSKLIDSWRHAERKFGHSGHAPESLCVMSFFKQNHNLKAICNTTLGNKVNFIDSNPK